SPVLSKQPGMFAGLRPLANWGRGGEVADGRQYASWIHEQDFVSLVQGVIEQDQPRRIYHACRPYPVTNATFMRVLRDHVGISFGLPLPRILAHIGSFVKGVDPSVLIQSVPGTTKSTLEDGFTFKFEKIDSTLANLVK